jgi:hypothetical protein
MKRRTPDRSDLEAIRQQILEFACSKHDFAAIRDEFLESGDWSATFGVTFKDSTVEERLHCDAPIGEHHVRFMLELDIDREIWAREYEPILREVSRHDVTLEPGTEAGERCRLTTRAWIPGFSQRIFGLTLSNLIDCKNAVRSLIGRLERAGAPDPGRYLS